MKLLLFSDLHLGKKGGNSFFLDLDKKAINEIVKETKKEKVNKIIFLGDLFHKSYNIRSSSAIFVAGLIVIVNG